MLNDAFSQAYFLYSLHLSLCGGEVPYFNAWTERSYRLLNKQKYVGHGQCALSLSNPLTVHHYIF